MSKGLTKAIKLEFKKMMETKWSLLFYLLVPSIIIALFAHFSRSITLFESITAYDYFCPRIIVLIIIFVTMQLTILKIVGERAPYGTLDRDLLAISRTGMFLGKIIANSLFVLLQCIVLYFVGFVVFPLSSNYANPLIIIFVLFIAGLFGLTLGLTLSVLSKSKEGAVQFIPFILLLLLMASDFFFIKFYQMPAVVETLSYISPMSLSYKLLEVSIADVYGFTDSLVSAWNANFLLKLGVWIFALLLIGLLKFNLEKRK